MLRGRGIKVPALDSLGILLVTIAITVGATVGVAGVAAQDDHGNETAEFAVLQGDRCVPIEPIGDGNQTVEEFYDYRTPETEPSSYNYSSFGTTHLQEDDTSIFFLYEGSDGLSLVLVHDRNGGNTAGGALTMQIEDLPEDGEWVIEDDDYGDGLGDGPYDEFDHDGSSSRITWAWDEGRNDGAAFNGGLDDEFAITIDPAFNDRADYRVYEGELTDWQAVSAADGDEFERTSLSMDEPAVILTGSCRSVAVTDLGTSEPAIAGESTEIEATVENDGLQAGTFDVTFEVEGDTVDEREVTLEPGENATVSTTVEFVDPGTYAVAVDDRTTNVTVTEPQEDGGDGTDGNESDGSDGNETDGTGGNESDGADGTASGVADELSLGFGVAAATAAIALGVAVLRRRS